MMILAQTQETVDKVVKLVDHAASANDRWLFIASLVVLILFAAAVIYWLVKSLEKKDGAHAAERKELSEKVHAASEKFNAELKQERHDARDQRQADQLAFLNQLEKIGGEVAALTATQKAATLLLEQHIRDTQERHRTDISKVVQAEIAKIEQAKKNS